MTNPRGAPRIVTDARTAAGDCPTAAAPQRIGADKAPLTRLYGMSLALGRELVHLICGENFQTLLIDSSTLHISNPP